MAKYDIKKMYAWPYGVRILVFASIFFLVMALGYIVDIGPYIDDINSSKSQETDLRSQLELMINKQESIKNKISQLPTAKALLINWQQKIATKAEIPAILDQILKLGQDNNLKIISFNPANEMKAGLYYKTPVSLDMTGTYDQTANFISQVTNMSKLISIVAFTMSNQKLNKTNDSTQRLNSDDILSTHLEIEIYRK